MQFFKFLFVFFLNSSIFAKLFRKLSKLMEYFIHQYHLRVIEKELNYASYQSIIDLNQIAFSNTLLKGLTGNVLILNANADLFSQIVTFLDKQENPFLCKISFVVENKKAFKKDLSKNFEIIKASGGIVVNDDKILMIFRRGKWDLPKGKIDEGEKAKTAAVREIAEECNLPTQIQEKLCTTWHHYWMKGKIVLKKTKWYIMTTSNPNQAHPQTEEDIEQILWASPKKIKNLLSNSFPSIEFVINQFISQKQTKTS